MIRKEEILELRSEWGLREQVIEKDYVLGWTLAAIAAHPVLSDTWVFKGGTALKKCHFETYRFSEDLDFTVVPDGPSTPEEVQPILQELAAWLYDHAGKRGALRSYRVDRIRSATVTSVPFAPRYLVEL